MKSVTSLLKGFLPLLIALITANAALAQNPLPVCSGMGAGLIHFTAVGPSGATDIYKMDPLNPGTIVPTGISLPLNSVSLAVSGNLNGGLPNVTYYTTFYIGLIQYLHYWNGTGWTNTTHIMNADAITGAGPYIYGLDIVNGDVYSYSGTGAASFAVHVGSVGAGDIAGDCAGNFYLLNQNATVPTMRKFSPSPTGYVQTTYTVTGANGGAGQGLAINGNKVFYDGTDGKLYTGTITGTNVNFVASTATPFTTNPTTDFASCGYAGVGAPKFTTDTIKFCAGASNTLLNATGPGPYNWTVLSGPAVITGSGSTVSVSSTTASVITHLDADCNGVNTLVDTTVIYVANATVDAGPDHTLIGCRGQYSDTLYGSLKDTSGNVSYDIQWGPLDAKHNYISGNTRMDSVIIGPSSTKKRDTLTYVVTVTTLSGCKFVDSMHLYLIDSTPTANFSYFSRFGCQQDTFRFVNQSTGSIDTIKWDFGDTTNSFDVSPVHIYKKQGIYSVLLTVSNAYCLDTARRVVFDIHDNVPDFKMDDSTVCVGTLIKFKDASKTTTGPPPQNIGPKYLYIFGDGATSTLSNPTHTYNKVGTYEVLLVLSNYLGCIDTARHTVVVDSLPTVKFITADTNICEGQALHIVSNYLSVGNTGITVDLGDGTVFQNRDTITYAFAKAGIYPVTLSAHYRICPDAKAAVNVIVNPFPGIYIGQDTVLCPNGAPIILSDRINLNNPAAKYLWNTGATTPSILAKDIGIYWARVTINGCSGSDSLEVHKDCYVDIPNSFTPDGDGLNDYFLPRQFLSRSLISFKMNIYNRWGQIIYQSSTVNGRGWDGKFNGVDQPQGVYVYQIDVSFDNGVKEHYTGNLTLLR